MPGGERQALPHPFLRAKVKWPSAAIPIGFQERCTLRSEHCRIIVIRHFAANAEFGGGPLRHGEHGFVAGQLIQQAAQHHGGCILQRIVNLLVGSGKQFVRVGHARPIPLLSDTGNSSLLAFSFGDRSPNRAIFTTVREIFQPSVVRTSVRSYQPLFQLSLLLATKR